MPEVDDTLMATMQARARSASSNLNVAVASIKGLYGVVKTAEDVDLLLDELRAVRQRYFAAQGALDALAPRVDDLRKEVSANKELVAQRGVLIEELQGQSSAWISERATMRQQVIELQSMLKEKGAPPALISKCGEILGTE